MKQPATKGATGEAKPPGERELARMLGPARAAFRALTEREGSTCEWRRYSAASPWVLKATCGERTLFYVRPEVGRFEVTVVLGERAAAAALAGRVREPLHEAIRTARRYAEGRPVRVIVAGEADLGGVDELLAVKLDPAPDRRSAGA